MNLSLLYEIIQLQITSESTKVTVDARTFKEVVITSPLVVRTVQGLKLFGLLIQVDSCEVMLIEVS